MNKDRHIEAIEKISRSSEVIEFGTTPGRAFILIANLQLALRHPENNGEGAQFVQEMIANMANAIATITDTPEILEIVAMGSHPEFDITREEFEEL